MRAWLHRINDVTLRFTDINQRMARSSEKFKKIDASVPVLRPPWPPLGKRFRQGKRP
ncbi:MAG: hypothetical protein R2875_16935 [Desulfobacterales bacterium]